MKEEEKKARILEEDVLSPETRIDEYIGFLERINDALDNTIYVLSKDARERCDAAVKEIFKLIIKVNILIERALIDSEDAPHLLDKIDDCIANLAARRGWMDDKVMADRKEEVQKMLLEGIIGAEQSFDFLEEQSVVIHDNFIEDGKTHHTISLMYSAENQGSGYSDGVDIEWIEDAPKLIRIYKDGDFAWEFGFDEDLEGGEFQDREDEDEEVETKPKSSLLPLMGAAALLTTAAVVKIASSSKKEVKTQIEEQVEQK